MKIEYKAIVAPREMVQTLAEVLKAAAEAKNQPCPAQLAALNPSQEARHIAESLTSGKNTAVFLGNIAQNHPQAAALHALAQELASLLGGKFGFLGEAANSVGGYIAGAVPFGAPAGKHAKAMLENPLKAYLLLNTEMELDCHNPREAIAAMRGAELVVAMSAYRHRASEYAHVLLPTAPFTETAGTFINTEGRAQNFNGTVKPLADARPAWKVLRVLGNLLGLAGFEQESIEQVRTEILPSADLPKRLDNSLRTQIFTGLKTADSALQRIGEVPIYSSDAIVRRATSLQKTRDARAPVAAMPGALFERFKLREGDKVKLTQERGSAILAARRDNSLPQNCVRVASAHPLTADLGDMFGEITVERAV